jgi:hypothetical protein
VSLFREWPPLGKHVKDLEAILGPPWERREDGVSFRFENGRFGVEWQFAIKDGKITRIRTYGIH